MYKRQAIRQREFDLVLLDINLPDGNGFELCKLIKPQHPDTIVIFLTANDQEIDQIRGYEVGAVDYITKPFVIGALQRKIKAMFAMLEHHKPAKDIYDDGRLFLDFSEQTASLNGKPLTLSPMEYKMLNLFRKNPRQVLKMCIRDRDTGFCPLRIMWCAPEHSIFSICRFWEKRQLPANPVKIKGYSDFMIFPQNKKFPINLVFGNIFGKSAGAVSPFPSGEEWRK